MSHETITIRRPHVPFGPVGVPPDQADADYLRAAARNIEFARCLGSNLTATVVRLLHDAADALTQDLLAALRGETDSDAEEGER